MSSRRRKTPGWAAFDPKNQPKPFTDIETHNHNDPYPPILTKITALQNHQNPSRDGNLTGKSFFSVLTHSSSVQNTIASEDAHSPSMSQSETLTSKYVENVSRVNEKLKVDHPWANENLIEDIMAAVDNDVDKASALLNEMAPHGRLQEKKITELDHNIEEVGLTATIDERLNEHNNSGSVLLGDNVPLGLMMDMSMVPMEPEWEDDDMYQMHRKEAIRAMRYDYNL